MADRSANKIFKINTNSGAQITIAGNGGGAFSGDGLQATNARLYAPAGVAVDTAGNIYIADAENNRVRKVTKSTGIINTIAGDGIAGYNGDGAAADSSELNYPTGVTVDVKGNVYIVDNGNNRIRMINTTGTISTVAGTGNGGLRVMEALQLQRNYITRTTFLSMPSELYLLLTRIIIGLGT